MSAESTLLARLALGAVGGLAGTLALHPLMTAVGKKWPESQPPIRQEPGEFMVEQAEEVLPKNVGDHIPPSAEKAAAQMLGLGYGMTFGALYAAMRPRGGSPFVDGMVLGAVCWAAGYLGWLPASGLLPPAWKQSSKQVIAPLAEHLVYGATTVAAYDALRAGSD